MKLPRLKPSPNPPFDESIKNRLEKELGVLFPVAMVELLRSWNGGYFDGRYEIPIPAPFPQSLDYYLRDGSWPIEGIPGFTASAQFTFNVEALIASGIEWELPNGVIPLGGDGHTWVALDYRDRDTAEPSVVFIETGRNQSHRLADGFAAFLEALVPVGTSG